MEEKPVSKTKKNSNILYGVIACTAVLCVGLWWITMNSTSTDVTGSTPQTLLDKMGRDNISSSRDPDKLTPEDITSFWIGFGLAFSSTIFIGTSFIFKKLGLRKLASQGTRADQGGYGYLKEWLWWAGMSLMILGEFANFAAYAFAPATLVTPLGALSVIVSSVLSSIFLREKLNILGKMGCALCVIGSTVMVLHSPQEQEVASMDILKEKVQEPGFVIYAFLMVGTAIFFMIFVAPKYGNRTVLVYITICSTLGSFTVMGCKGVGVAIHQTLHGQNQFTNWLTYVFLSAVIICILVQMNFLNRALDIYNTAVVTPIYYVFFTTCVIVASLVLYKEFFSMSTKDIFGFICGFLIICMGIFQLNAFRDVNISLKNLPKAHRDELPKVSLNGGSINQENTDEQRLLENDSISAKDYHDEDDSHPI
ncbi:magnesium transporter NIPA2-like isoform X2 [Mytilus galloprovincialis]|uniref:magnesium transporter NIPA2-like isoform X2 n=1 Tax=Mytilus galloprovincialis TaxID=29158 RepID=UPI003F7CD05D